MAKVSSLWLPNSGDFTRVYYGSVEPAYGDERGGGMLEKKGVILAGDLMGTKARLLLLALAEVGNNREDLRRYFK